jgi:8-oxo-dGTP diphosphatase
MAEIAPPGAARPLMAAAALFFNHDGDVMIVKPNYKPGWELPGGYVEAEESPLMACVREVEEELGIKPEIGDLLSVDWAPHPEQGDKVLFIFDGGVLTERVQSAIRLQADELTEWRYCAIDRLDEQLIPRLARRVSQSAAARRIGATRYLEHGRTQERHIS